MNATEIFHSQIKLTQRTQQIDIGRGEAQRCQQDVLCGKIAFLSEQQLSIAQRLGWCVARCLHGLRQEIFGQLRLTCARISFRNQGHSLGILKVLVERSPKLADRRIGVVSFDLPCGVHLERAGMGWLFGQNLLDMGSGTHLVTGGEEHLGKRNLDIEGLVQRLGLGQRVLKRRNCLLLVPLGELEAGFEDLKGHRIGAFGHGLLDLGADGIGIPKCRQETDQADRWDGIFGRGSL